MEATGIQVPVMLSVTVSDTGGRTLSGQTLEAFLASVQHANIFSVGLNCSFGARQLKPFLEKNKDLILVVQAGMIGAWGEWHSSIQGLENSEETKAAVLEKLLSVVPVERNVQVRLPEFKNLLKDKPELYKRLSFHDDFIVIRPDRWDADMHEGTVKFDQIVKESPYLVVDGCLLYTSPSPRDA